MAAASASSVPLSSVMWALTQTNVPTARDDARRLYCILSASTTGCESTLTALALASTFERHVAALHADGGASEWWINRKDHSVWCSANLLACLMSVLALPTAKLLTHNWTLLMHLTAALPFQVPFLKAVQDATLALKLDARHMAKLKEMHSAACRLYTLACCERDWGVLALRDKDAYEWQARTLGESEANRLWVRGAQLTEKARVAEEAWHDMAIAQSRQAFHEAERTPNYTCLLPRYLLYSSE